MVGLYFQKVVKPDTNTQLHNAHMSWKNSILRIRKQQSIVSSSSTSCWDLFLPSNTYFPIRTLWTPQCGVESCASEWKGFLTHRGGQPGAHLSLSRHVFICLTTTASPSHHFSRHCFLVVFNLLLILVVCPGLFSFVWQQSRVNCGDGWQAHDHPKICSTL